MGFLVHFLSHFTGDLIGADYHGHSMGRFDEK
jgi:hypothetical protein